MAISVDGWSPNLNQILSFRDIKHIMFIADCSQIFVLYKPEDRLKMVGRLSNPELW
jgi:hypothetical protein